MYIIKQYSSDITSFFLKMNRSIPEWSEEEKNAYSFQTKQKAERMLRQIVKASPNVGALEIVRDNNAICTHDCFHCRFSDCRNDDAKQTIWERQALRSVKMDF